MNVLDSRHKPKLQIVISLMAALALILALNLFLEADALGGLNLPGPFSADSPRSSPMPLAANAASVPLSPPAATATVQPSPSLEPAPAPRPSNP